MVAITLSTICFLALSGLMAAVDAAVLSVTHPEIEVMKKESKWGAHRLSRVKHDLARAVVVIVILSNTVNVLGPILVSVQAFNLYGREGLAVITVVLATGTIVFSEIVPKSLGAHYAPLIARLSAPAILTCQYLLYPLVAGFAWLSSQFARGTRKIGTEEQIRSLVKIGHLAGHIEQDENRMIHRVFVLNDKTAGEIMTPIDHVKAIGASYTIKQAAAAVGNCRFSRYPIFGETVDDVKGIALIREVLRSAQDRPEESVTAIARPPFVVDAKMKADTLIAMFHNRHVHLAVVQDIGKTVGLVTLDDVLDQLIGNDQGPPVP